jgi:hypothetical protein
MATDRSLSELLGALDATKAELAVLLRWTWLAAESEVGQLAKVHAMLDRWQDRINPNDPEAWAILDLAEVLDRIPWGGQPELLPVPERVLCGVLLPTPLPLDLPLRCQLDRGHNSVHVSGQVRWFA